MTVYKRLRKNDNDLKWFIQRKKSENLDLIRADLFKFIEKRFRNYLSTRNLENK